MTFCSGLVCNPQEVVRFWWWSGSRNAGIRVMFTAFLRWYALTEWSCFVFYIYRAEHRLQTENNNRHFYK